MSVINSIKKFFKPSSRSLEEKIQDRIAKLEEEFELKAKVKTQKVEVVWQDADLIKAKGLPIVFNKPIVDKETKTK